MDLKTKLRIAALQGAALAAAGCLGISEERVDDAATGGNAPGGGAQVANTGGQTGIPMTVEAPENTVPLEGLGPAPEGQCLGTDYGQGGGYYGTCCSTYSCRESIEGHCPTLEHPLIYTTPGYPPGSGSCSCSAHAGPFAHAPNRAALGEGECCYVFYGIGCDGRPLHQEGKVLLAPIVNRDDWC